MDSRSRASGLQLRAVLSINKAGQEQIVALDASRYDIGRAIQASLRINHPEISRQQAVIIRDDSGRYQLFDGDGLGASSTNGTFVNGARIQHKQLQSGDVIRFGTGAVTARFFQAQSSTPPKRAMDDELPDIETEEGDQFSTQAVLPE